jgi:hypothetical protein
MHAPLIACASRALRFPAAHITSYTSHAAAHIRKRAQMNMLRNKQRALRNSILINPKCPRDAKPTDAPGVIFHPGPNDENAFSIERINPFETRPERAAVE